LLLSNAPVNPAALRRRDAVITFKARRVDMARLSLGAVAGQLNMDHGVLLVNRLTADILGGKLSMRGRFDVATDLPTADVDIKVTDAQLGQVPRKATGEPPLDGLLSARVTVTGRGRSIHQVAATANGTATAVLPHGTIRASLAELIGMDLRGIGLLLTKQQKQAGIRCGVASFQAHDGTLTAQSLVMDTDPVLITGVGTIHLDSEAVDLVLHGRPKTRRLLRLSAPVEVRGRLAHPTFGLRTAEAVGQTAGAVALGLVLTPLAAVLAFVDPQLAKDADCAALLAQAKAPPDTPGASR
jgi:uncharacterized protein involved in outer membrane biogenesis